MRQSRRTGLRGAPHGVDAVQVERGEGPVERSLDTDHLDAVELGDLVGSDPREQAHPAGQAHAGQDADRRGQARGVGEQDVVGGRQRKAVLESSTTSPGRTERSHRMAGESPSWTTRSTVISRRAASAVATV